MLILPSFFTGSVQGITAVKNSLELWKYKDKLEYNLFIEGIDIEVEKISEIVHRLNEYMEDEGAVYQDFSQNLKNLQLYQMYPDKNTLARTTIRNAGIIFSLVILLF